MSIFLSFCLSVFLSLFFSQIILHWVFPSHYVGFGRENNLFAKPIQNKPTVVISSKQILLYFLRHFLKTEWMEYLYLPYFLSKETATKSHCRSLIWKDWENVKQFFSCTPQFTVDALGYLETVFGTQSPLCWPACFSLVVYSVNLCLFKRRREGREGGKKEGNEWGKEGEGGREREREKRKEGKMEGTISKKLNLKIVGL